jgi:CRP-like cAMP-binding protein
VSSVDELDEYISSRPQYLAAKPPCGRQTMASNTVQRIDPQSFLASVRTGKSIVRYQQAQPIFQQGDAADAVFYIEKGKVKITVVSEQGKEGAIAILEPGEFFGEGCLAGQALHLATAGAMSECVIVRIEKDTMIRQLRDDPTFSQLFMSFLLSRNVQIEADLVDQLFNSSEKRLARVLMLLAHFGKDGKMEPVIPHINQEGAVISLMRTSLRNARQRCIQAES